MLIKSKNRLNILQCLMLLVSIILCIPSIQYLLKNKTVAGYSTYYSYFLAPYSGQARGLLEGIIVIALLLIFSLIYVFIVKKEKEIFKTKKSVAWFIIIISLIFTMILPMFSSDIFYYIGDSWIAAEYNENPYYTTVKDLQDNNINDEILENTGYWRNTTSVYGPMWNNIATLLSSLSFGSITVALFIYKIAAFMVHIVNCYLIYKITRNTKNVLLYGLNPLVLVELLSNVHNDIYLIMFILVAIYFLFKNKNIYGFIFFLALSVATKYSSAILVPFLLIYYFKDSPTLLKRILSCILSGLMIVGIVILLYLPYYRDISIFTNMLVQNTKYSQSIITLMILKGENKLIQIIDTYKMQVFALVYVILLIRMLFKKNIEFKDICNKINILMFIFIFLVLTTFQKWYILWMIPTILYSSKNIKQFFYILTYTSFIPSLVYFKIGDDAFGIGVSYSLIMLLLAIFIYATLKVIIKYSKEKGLKE